MSLLTTDLPTVHAVLGWARLYRGQIETGLSAIEATLAMSGGVPTHEALCEAGEVSENSGMSRGLRFY